MNNRVECEKHVCNNELYRLRYGLENLLKNQNYDDLDNHEDAKKYDPILQSSPSVYMSQLNYDPNEYRSTVSKSLLYKVLESKLYNCLHNNQQIDTNFSNDIESALSHHLSSFPSEISTSTVAPAVSNTLEVNDYQKSTLAVPTSKTSRLKKSKKKKNKSSSKRKPK